MLGRHSRAAAKVTASAAQLGSVAVATLKTMLVGAFFGADIEGSKVVSSYCSTVGAVT